MNTFTTSSMNRPMVLKTWKFIPEGFIVEGYLNGVTIRIPDIKDGNLKEGTTIQTAKGTFQLGTQIFEEEEESDGETGLGTDQSKTGEDEQLPGENLSK